MEDDSIEEIEVNPTVSGDAGVAPSGDSLESGATCETGASPMELDSTTAERGGDDDGAVRVSGSERSEEVSPGAHKGDEEDANKGKDEVSEIVKENNADSPIERTNLCSDVDNKASDDRFGERGTKSVEKKMQMRLKEEKRGDESSKYAAANYNSLLSEFDDYVASERMGPGISRALSYGFQVGDLVWGKVKSHPWWPGHIFNEAFATVSVRRTRRVGHVLVAFFGDSSYGWFDPAELVPFEPHFSEKSQQMNSKFFLRAVEEAVEEARRRSALGLICNCRSPSNFRPTTVEGYLAVDVPDYEAQTVYSAEQIKNARDAFSPDETLLFVKQLALAPLSCDSDDLDYVKKKAVVSALRKAVFEEFDEPYAQAFGAKSAQSLPQEPPSKEPSRAPLSGPLVIAETLGDPKISKKPVKTKDSMEQEKYAFRRRDEGGGDSRTDPFGQVQEGFDRSAAVDYVLQKRAPAAQIPGKHEQAGLVSSAITFQSRDVLGEELAQASEERIRDGDVETIIDLNQDETRTALETSPGSSSHISPSEGKKSAAGITKKTKVPKRTAEEMGSENNPPPLKNKKKKEIGSQHREKGKMLSSGEGTTKKSLQIGSAQREKVARSQKNMRNTGLEVPQILGYLHDVALDPFCGSTDKSSVRVVRQFFMRFRSHVYQKSVASSSSEPSEMSKHTKPVKPRKAVNRIDDPSKAGKKRLPSDRQEEIALVKKRKKVDQLKPTGSEKKTGQETKEQAGVVPGGQVRTTKSQPAKKAAPPQARVVEPTMLIMKFPPGTALPSPAKLKARFGRFGMLDQSAIRVFWKSSTCRVVFMFKGDAQTAFNYASGKSLFGNVRYYLREVEAHANEPPEQQKGKADESSKEAQEWSVQAPPLHQPILPPPALHHLKSCLKKPGDDSGGGSNGNGNRGAARVKFMLDGEDNGGRTAESSRNGHFIKNSNNGNYMEAGGGNGLSSSSSSSSVAMEFVSKNIQNVVPPPLHASTLPPILPLPPQFAKSSPLNNMDRMDPPSRNMHGPDRHHVGVVDISHQMLNLLSKCNDVVTNVTGLLGYVPYHPL